MYSYCDCELLIWLKKVLGIEATKTKQINTSNMLCYFMKNKEINKKERADILLQPRSALAKLQSCKHSVTKTNKQTKKVLSNCTSHNKKNSKSD